MMICNKGLCSGKWQAAGGRCDMKRKKTVSWILSLMLVVTMIPALTSVANAEDSTDFPAISIGSGDIKKGAKVYMGVRNINGSIVPISWLVLGGANSTNLKDGDVSVDPSDARLLIAEKTQGVTQFVSNGSNNVWQGSTAQTWCSDFLTGSDGNTDHFTAAEEAVPLSTSKSESEYGDWGVSSLANERVFFLSAEEVSNDYFDDSNSRIAYRYDNGQAHDWWLRSPIGDGSDSAARVSPSGDVEDRYVNIDLGARPAFNFNLKSVLFTSAAEGGKSSGITGADALRKISTTSTNEWKLTLHDSSRDVVQYIAKSGADLSITEGYDSWSVSIIGETDEHAFLPVPKENEYVSVILAESSGKALYYGHIANGDMVVPESIAIPKGLVAGDYKLHIFSEEINEDKFTDYASAFSTIDLTVEALPVETFTVTFKAEGGSWQDGTTEKTQTVESGQAATAPADPTREGFTFDGWDKDFRNITSDLTVKAKWKENTTPPQPATQTITASDVTKTFGNAAFNLNAKTSGDGALTYKSSNTKVATVSNAGKVTIKGAGTAKITISAAATANYLAASKAITVTVKKAANPLTIKPKTATVKYSKLKKKTQTLAVTKVINFKRKINDKKTYTLSSAKKGSKSFKMYFKINKSTGKVTIKKNKKMKKGTYKVKVKVKALGNANYNASKVKTVTFKIRVK